jgi:hypothetical protein
MNEKWKPEHEDDLILCFQCDEHKSFELMAKRGSQKPYICKACINTINRCKDKEERRKKDRARYE